MKEKIRLKLEEIYKKPIFTKDLNIIITNNKKIDIYFKHSYLIKYNLNMKDFKINPRMFVFDLYFELKKSSEKYKKIKEVFTNETKN